MSRVWIRLAAVLLLIAATAVLVPSSMPSAGAEDFEVPEYSPVELEAESVEPLPLDEKPPYAPDSSAYLPDEGGYVDPSISVRIEKIRAYDTDIRLAWVQIADPSQLRTELNRPYPSKSTAYAELIAKRVKAVLAINGDYFIDRKEGVIVRNGEVLRTNYYTGFDALVIDMDGDFHILHEPDEAAFAPYEGNIMHAFSFGPGLIIDGVRTTEYTAKTMSPTKPTQRMALCQMDHLSYLVVCGEGPEQRNSEGMTLDQFSRLLEKLGVRNAYNLDGGSSTWLVLDDRKINARSKKRSIADIVYFVTAVPGEGQ